MRRSLILTATLSAVCSAWAGSLRAQAPAPVDASGSSSIMAAELQRHVEVLAHDSMAGRDTPSPELVQTALYIAELFESYGLRPALGDDYLQWFPLTSIQPGASASQVLVVRGPDREYALSPDADFVAVPVGGLVEASGALVTSSSGGEEATGAVMVVRADPQTLGATLGNTRVLLENGAEGVLVVVDATASYLRGVRQFFAQDRLSVGDPLELRGPVMIVAGETLPPALGRAVASGAIPEGWSAELRSTARVRADSAMNVVGWLEGSDPVLKDELVVITAHMDHVGIGRPLGRDSIYNGADDNASGTAAVLELAQAFARGPRPRRSVVFMAVSGEEKGLLGSEWYAEHPLFPLESTVANLNIDMIGRNWEDTVVAIGKQESSLGTLVDRVAAEHPELGLAVIDDIWPEERFYFRSDHYNFARRGVPVLFFFSGVHEDYHRPSDEAPKVRYGKAARITQLLYFLVLEIANADERPVWDAEAYRRVVGDGSG